MIFLRRYRKYITFKYTKSNSPKSCYLVGDFRINDYIYGYNAIFCDDYNIINKYISLTLRVNSQSALTIDINLDGRLRSVEAYNPLSDIKQVIIDTPYKESNSYCVQIKTNDVHKYVFNHTAIDCMVTFKLPNCSIYIKHPIPNHFLRKN